MEVLKIKVNGVWQTVPAIKGTDGTPGTKGDPGADGFSPVAKVETITNGATITITDKNGTTTATILNGAKGTDGSPGIQGPQGEPGTNGTTPVKGVDYYTEADKQEMVQLVLAAIPSAEEVNY